MTSAWVLGGLGLGLGLAACGGAATPAATPSSAPGRDAAAGTKADAEAGTDTETETDTDTDTDTDTGAGAEPVLVLGALAPLEPGTAGGIGLRAGSTPPSSGSLDRDAIKAVVHAARSKFAACYEGALTTAPDLAGTVHVEFTIGASGAVTNAIAQGLGQGVDECVAAELRALVFPPPTGGGAVIVRYPFTFKPT